MTVSKSVEGDSSSEGAASHKSRNLRRHRLFVRGLVLPCRIGVHRHERDSPQRVRLSVELDIDDVLAPRRDAIEEVVNYDDVVRGVRQMVRADHINLVESLAERILEFCLKDERVARARVTVEKLDVFGDDAVVGIEIEGVTGG